METTLCYKFKEIIYTSNGILDNCIDATYIINLEGNGRIDQIYTQLEYIHPTKIVLILFNKGFNKCNKNIHAKIPPVDLVDSYYTIFKDAQSNNFNNILILEDDFIFDNKLEDKNICTDICMFLNKHNNTSFMYILGCLPFIQFPYSDKNRLVLLKSGTHDCIYSKKLREEILHTEQTTITDWDLYTNFNVRQFMYYIPLCYQLFPETENSQHHTKVFILYNLHKKFKKYLHLDKSTDGYMVYYNYVSHIVFIVLIILFILLLYVGIKKN